jgi:hypothetical protein
VFPEDDLRLGFWQFVAGRAGDGRFDNVKNDNPVLNGIEFNRDAARIDLESISKIEAEKPDGFKQGNGTTLGYASIQDALLAYLIQRASKAPSILEGFPYNYTTWLRTVILVMADAACEPDRLTLHIPVNEEGEYDPQSSRLQEYTMRTDGPWDCLSRDTFDTIRKHFAKAG